MPTPQFILDLRKKIGHELLLLTGVSALVFNDAGQILLQKRADTGGWAVIGGIPEPGQELADVVVREVKEETGVTVEPVRVTGVYTNPVITYPNGDVAQYITIAFACRVVAGTPHVADEESIDVQYFDTRDLPPMRPDHRLRIEHALANRDEAFFTPPTRQT